jgi:hypothetical protein
MSAMGHKMVQRESEVLDQKAGEGKNHVQKTRDFARTSGVARPYGAQGTLGAWGLLP